MGNMRFNDYYGWNICRCLVSHEPPRNARDDFLQAWCGKGELFEAVPVMAIRNGDSSAKALYHDWDYAYALQLLTAGCMHSQDRTADRELTEIAASMTKS